MICDLNVMKKHRKSWKMDTCHIWHGNHAWLVLDLCCSDHWGPGWICLVSQDGPVAATQLSGALARLCQAHPAPCTLGFWVNLQVENGDDSPISGTFGRKLSICYIYNICYTFASGRRSFSLEDCFGIKWHEYNHSQCVLVVVWFECVYLYSTAWLFPWMSCFSLVSMFMTFVQSTTGSFCSTGCCRYVTRKSFKSHRAGGLPTGVPEKCHGGKPEQKMFTEKISEIFLIYRDST